LTQRRHTLPPRDETVPFRSGGIKDVVLYSFLDRPAILAEKTAMKHTLTICTAFLAAVLTACGGGGDSATTGQVRLLLSDTPVEAADKVVVSIAEVVALRVDGDEVVEEVLVDSVQEHDLLELQNGVTAELAVKPLPVGEYQGLRLRLSGGGSPVGPPGSPTPNYIVIGRDEFPLYTPSGTQTGLKLTGPFEVTADVLTELVIDFNVRRSVVKRGKKDEYLLKPVLKLIQIVISGSISGTVESSDDTVELEDAVVSAQQVASGDTFHSEVLSAMVAENGTYRLSPVEQGTYDVVASAPGFAPQLEEDVTVVAEEDTDGIDFTLEPSDTGTIEGTAPSGEEYSVLLLWKDHYLAQAAADTTTSVFSFTDVAVGTYDLVLLEDGLEVDRIENVTVTADSTTDGHELEDS
jgi:hypothetical protein